jgi:hypothetical protein
LCRWCSPLPIATSSSAYFFTRGGAVEVADAQIRLRLPDGNYRLEFFRPADGTPIGEPANLSSPGLRLQITHPLPRFTDDLALRIVRTFTPPRRT